MTRHTEIKINPALSGAILDMTYRRLTKRLFQDMYKFFDPLIQIAENQDPQNPLTKYIPKTPVTSMVYQDDYYRVGFELKERLQTISLPLMGGEALNIGIITSEKPQYPLKQRNLVLQLCGNVSEEKIIHPAVLIYNLDGQIKFSFFQNEQKQLIFMGKSQRTKIEDEPEKKLEEKQQDLMMYLLKFFGKFKPKEDIDWKKITADSPADKLAKLFMAPPKPQPETVKESTFSCFGGHISNAY